jgi:flagellar M-ring protein FliF
VNVINESFTKPVEPEPIPGPPVWEQPWLWDVVKHVVGVILVIVVFFGVLKPLWNSLMKSVPVIAAVQAPPPAIAGPSGEVQDDMLSLSGDEQKKLEGPHSPHDRHMATAHQAVQDDPKLVAQVVKNWVTEDE